MKFLKAISIFPVLLIFACEEVVLNPLEVYTIPKGKHYSTFKVEMLQQDQLTFHTTFDESAEYHLDNEVNQWDTNKLLGFSDCNSHHHENSARFGWLWMDGKIDIMVYCYVNGERINEKIGETLPGQRNYYQIRLSESEYTFVFDNQVMSIPRSNTCDEGAYYMLFPYFGGDEVAPHDISIYIERQYR